MFKHSTYRVSYKRRPRPERRKFHYIYKITCLLDNRFYIGMHSTDYLGDFYFGSGNLIKESIEKHGIFNHRKEVIEFCPNRRVLKRREREIVNRKLLKDKLCMNLVIGGGGFKRG